MTRAFSLSLTLALAVATQTITRSSGSFSDSKSVSIQSTTSDDIEYGSTPSQSSIPNTGAATIAHSATANVNALKNGHSPTNSLSKSGTGIITYYVAKTGSDLNTCEQAQSIATPKKTIGSASGGLACLNDNPLSVEQST
jgi:hypothetical protein